MAVERGHEEKENVDLKSLESAIQTLSLDTPKSQSYMAELVKTPVVTRSTRSKAAPKKPVKRVLLRDK